MYFYWTAIWFSAIFGNMVFGGWQDDTGPKLILDKGMCSLTLR